VSAHDDSVLSREIAREAGVLLLEVRSSYADLDPADRERARLLRDTGDREAHDLIAARLASARPDDVVLSEEGVDDAARLDARRLWIVDPLDGTWEYGQGRSDFAVHVALWTRTPEGGELSAGTVDLPAQGVTWSVLDDVPVAGAVPTDRPVRVVVSRSRRPARLDDTVARLATRLAELGVTGRGVEVVRGGVGGRQGRGALRRQRRDLPARQRFQRLGPRGAARRRAASRVMDRSAGRRPVRVQPDAAAAARRGDGRARRGRRRPRRAPPPLTPRSVRM
jgi:3'(2'), 5'-bisphosphate nucleotidase